MIRNLLLAGAVLLGFAGPAAVAQTATDAETQELIERLRPVEQRMRGLRRPGADGATTTPDSGPMLIPGAPEGTRPGAESAAPSATSVARDTTAPPDMAAVSITVNFASGSYALTPQAGAALTALGRALASPELQAFRFRIEGHTDTMGDAGKNMALSQRRAESVRDYLVNGFGIAPSRLVAKGFGEEQLLVPTRDSTSEPRNRRVQVVNLDG